MSVMRREKDNIFRFGKNEELVWMEYAKGAAPAA
jgi:hypothetical protein